MILYMYRSGWYRFLLKHIDGTEYITEMDRSVSVSTLSNIILYISIIGGTKFSESIVRSIRPRPFVFRYWFGRYCHLCSPLKSSIKSHQTIINTLSITGIESTTSMLWFNSYTVRLRALW